MEAVRGALVRIKKNRSHLAPALDPALASSPILVTVCFEKSRKVLRQTSFWTSKPPVVVIGHRRSLCHLHIGVFVPGGFLSP